MTRTYTEREVVLRERVAFTRGWKEWQSVEHEDDVFGAALRCYPLPTVTRPRVVDDPPGHRLWQWRVLNGQLQCRWNGFGGWNTEWGSTEKALERIEITPERIKMWADLLDNPNETIAAD